MTMAMLLMRDITIYDVVGLFGVVVLVSLIYGPRELRKLQERERKRWEDFQNKKWK